MPRYSVRYDETAIAEFDALRRFEQVRVIDSIERHLFDNPARESRSSIKKLDPPVIAAYRLRVGDYRVFYNVDDVSLTIEVVAIRFKGRQTLAETADGSNN